MPKVSPYDKAIEALDKTNGDKDQAVDLIFAWCQANSDDREAFGNYDRSAEKQIKRVAREWVNRVYDDRVYEDHYRGRPGYP